MSFSLLSLIPPVNPAFLEATALMFVAYTGYGRIATLGKVREPRRTIPLAIIVTLVLTALLYFGVCASSALPKRKDRVLDLSPFSPKKSVGRS